MKIEDTIRIRKDHSQAGPHKIADERSQAENEEIEQPLGTRARIFREKLIDEYVNRRKKESVTDAMQDVDRHGHPGHRVQGEDREAHHMSQDTDYHRVATA